MITLLNDVIKALGTVAGWAINLLPNSPFNFSVSSFSSWLATINYFIPFADIVTELGVYVTAVAAYYVIRAVLRWTKVGD